MISPSEIAALADSRFEQHFLVSHSKLSKIISAAGIRSTDHVVEIGAGIGTVATALPRGESLTLIELDARLTGLLREYVPYARVLQGDALELIRKVPCDVLISNLPWQVTEELLSTLPDLTFRTAVLAVGDSTDLDSVRQYFAWREVTTITGDDFIPPQVGVSKVVCLTRLKQARPLASGGRCALFMPR